MPSLMPEFSRKSISSSGKSSIASICARNSMTDEFKEFTRSENSPFIERAAARADFSLVASIRSAIASACVRSILLFRNALSVNSPGRASRRPADCPTSSLQYVFACVRSRSAEADENHSVDELSLAVANASKRCSALGKELTSMKRLFNGINVRGGSRNPDNSDSAFSCGTCPRHNRIILHSHLGLV